MQRNQDKEKHKQNKRNLFCRRMLQIIHESKVQLNLIDKTSDFTQRNSKSMSLITDSNLRSNPTKIKLRSSRFFSY